MSIKDNSGSNALFCIVGIVVVIIIVLGVISIFSSSGGIADIQEVSMKKPSLHMERLIQQMGGNQYPLVQHFQLELFLIKIFSIIKM